MHRLFPVFFSFLVSSSPIIVSTAVLLGTLLSYGQPNIPEIETETKSERHEIHKSESNVMTASEIVGRDLSFASEETNGSKIEVVDKSFELTNPVRDDNSYAEVDKPLYLVDDGEFVTEEHCEEHLVEESKIETDEVKVVLGSHYSPLQQSEDEHVVLESDDKLWEGSADPLNSDPALLWKRVEGDGYDDEDDDDDDDDDSGSDIAESSSPDASMADIIPMLDELHPLLSEEQEIRQEHNHEDGNGIKSQADSEHSIHSSDSSSESNDEDDVQSHKDSEPEDEEEDKEKHSDKEDEPRSAITWTEDDQKNLMNIGTSEMERNMRLENLIARRKAIRESKDTESEDEEEDKEEKHTDKDNEPRSAITWTEDDQKNLMNLGTSEMERNRRLENLIARRRARKTMRMQAEKNLIDLESTDLPWHIPPISTARNNPFDYDLNEHIPGSAPSVLLKRRNPFDLPYDSSEEKPDLVGDTLQEFTGFQPKEPVFRRHESFNVGPSNFGAFRNERHESKLKPYFVPERVFQRQFSGISDSKASSVPDTESVSSDHENLNNEEDDEQNLETELVSEKDQEHEEVISESEHVIHERPYFVPEHVDIIGTGFYERQVSEVSESKLSSIPDTDSVSSVDDVENKDHIDLTEEPELISFEDDHLDGNVESVQMVEPELISFEDDHLDGNVESVQVVEEDERVDENVRNEEPELISFEDEVDGNVESVQMVERDERLDEGEISDGDVINEQEVVNVTSSMVDEGHSSSVSSLSSLDEVSEQIYNEKESDDDEVASSVSERSGVFVDDGNLTERSEIDVTSLVVEESHGKEPVYDTSPRGVSRNFSSSSIANILQETLERNGSKDSQETLPKTVDLLEAGDVGSRSVVNDDVNELGLSVGLSVVDDHVHKDESFQQTNESSQQEEVEVPSLDSNGRFHESSQQQKEVVSQPLAEDFEELQVQELEQGEITSSTSEIQFTEVVHEETFENVGPTHHLVISEEEEEGVSEIQRDISANEASKEDLELLQVQNTTNNNNLDNLPTHDVSLNNNPVLNGEPELVEDGGIETEQVGNEVDPSGDIHGTENNNVPDDNIEDVDEVNEIDEDLLVELDAVGDFSVNDLKSTSNDMEDDHVLETKLSADEDSLSKDLGMEQHPQILEHEIESKHSGDEASKSKDLGESLDDEMKQEDPQHLETMLSGDEDSSYYYSQPIKSSLNESRQEDPLGHDLETFYSVDEYAFSKIVESTLNDMKHEPHALDRVLETSPSGDEDLYPTHLSKLQLKLDEEEEEAMEIQNEKESNTEVSATSEEKSINNTNEVALSQETKSKSSSDITVNHEMKNESSKSNTDKE